MPKDDEEPKNKGSFWGEGEHIDAWSVIHFLTGWIIGIILNILGFDFWSGFPVALILLILWEFIEPKIWPGWDETKKNQILDVIIGMLGYSLGKFIDHVIDSNFEDSLIIKLILLLILIIIQIIWIIIIYRMKKKLKKKKAKKKKGE